MPASYAPPSAHEAPSPGPALLLAIENSNPSSAVVASDGEVFGPSVAVARCAPGHPEAGFELLANEPIRATARDRDDLVPAIDRACARAGVRPAELAVIAVSAGPGGYTAVRSASSVGKMMAWGIGARCIAVPSACVAALGAWDDEAFGVRQEPCLVCLAGKDQTAFATRFEPAPTWHAMIASAHPIGLIGARELERDGVRRLAADAHLPGELRAAAARLGLPIVSPRFSALLCARVACALPTIDPRDLNPIYPREPDAVTLWRNRGTKSPGA